MPITKRKLASGKISWGYHFSIGPRAACEQFKRAGFPTKEAAQTAEAEVLLKAKAAPIPVANPKTLAQVIASFIEDGAEQRSPKTTARYREMARYLSPAITSASVSSLTSLLLHEEWRRLSKEGGHFRKTKDARPLAAKTVRNVAGLVSAAFSWAILYGLCALNPVTASRPPRGGGKRKAIALSPAQQDLLIAAASGPWCMSMFLECEAALGARRGEILALRWSDLRDGYAYIGRSLGQVDATLYFKSTKTGEPRVIEVPPRTLALLEAHRVQQQAFRAQCGDLYAADKDLIFATPEGNELRPDSVSAAVSLACRRLKLPKGASLHALRHTHGSRLLAAGVPVAEVSERLGHANPRTTLAIYTHLVPGSGRAAHVWDELRADAPAQEKRQ